MNLLIVLIGVGVFFLTYFIGYKDGQGGIIFNQFHTVGKAIYNKVVDLLDKEETEGKKKMEDKKPNVEPEADDWDLNIFYDDEE